jgi:glycosyltransferase involved in cell wall biosynthesis
MSVILCSYNGAAGVDQCLRALDAQTVRPALEVIVVDDGSTDATSEVARGYDVVLVCHEHNKGVAAGRNSGVRRATAPLIAFLDDDCEPDPGWAEQLLQHFAEGMVALGGELAVGGRAGFMHGYLARHNPLGPQELSLAAGSSLPYRFWLYLRRQWQLPPQTRQRDVFTMPTANLALRRADFLHIGGFDDRVHFAGEDDDLCRRLRLAFPAGRLVYRPSARVVHHFDLALSDTLRRRRAYGRGAAFMFRKWPDVPPVIFPWPVVMAVVLAASVAYPVLLGVAALLPQLLYPQGVRAAAAGRGAACLLDPYVQLAEESATDLGFAQGLWIFRRLLAEPRSPYPGPTGGPAAERG